MAGSSSTTPPDGGSVLAAAPRPARVAGLPARRRPLLAAVGIGAVAVGAAGAVVLVSNAGSSASVLAVARTVPVGAVVSDADLAVARVGRDAALAPVPAAERSRIVGQRAAVTLTPGSLLTASEVTARPVPGVGQQLVAVALKPGQLPAAGLRGGDRVLVVLTAADSGGTDAGGTSRTAGNAAAAVPAPAVSVTARVYESSAPAQDGSVVVDLLAAGSDGVTIAQQASTGRVTLVQLPAGG